MDSSLSPQELNDLKSRLSERFDELREIIRAELIRSDDEHFQDLAGRVHDLEEESVADLLVDINLAMIDHHVQEIREVERALLRLSAGTYGRCVDCGNDIESARLSAYPSASRCIACQSRRESNDAQAKRPTL